MTSLPDPSPDPRHRRRRIVILLVFIGLILALIFAFRAVLTPFLVAIFLTYLLYPVVDRMAPWRLFGRFPVGRGGSIALLYLLLIAAIYVGAVFSIPALGKQLRQAQDDLPRLQAVFEKQLARIVEKAQDWWGDDSGSDPGLEEGREEENAPEEETAPKEKPNPEPPPAEVLPARSRFHLEGGGLIEAEIVARSETQVVLRLGHEYQVLDSSRIEREEKLQVAEPIDPKQYSRKLIDALVRRLGDILRLTVAVIRTIVTTFVQLVLILMVTAFLLIDRQAIVRFIQSVPPKNYQVTWKHLMVYIDRGLAGVIRGQLLICAVNGVLTWVGLEFLGVRYAGLLGFIAGVFSLIPIFGTILSTIPIVLIAWGAGGFASGLLALGWILLIHFIEANFLNPKIMGTASKIHPVVVIFALIAGEHAYGIVGALLAVPAASIIQSCFKFYVIDRAHEVPDDDVAAEIA